jgi:hypothetical protein
MAPAEVAPPPPPAATTIVNYDFNGASYGSLTPVLASGTTSVASSTQPFVVRPAPPPTAAPSRSTPRWQGTHDGRFHRTNSSTFSSNGRRGAAAYRH